MNITSISFLNRYIRTGMPLVSKRLTVDGNCIEKPQNVIVPIGTPINKILEFCGGLKSEPKKILLGGPMMGITVFDTEIPILKQNNAILALDEKQAETPEATACIRCGRCVASCPMNLMPAKVDKAINKKLPVDFNALGVMYCIECGSCAFNCPAKRPLTQVMRLAKAEARKHKN